MAENKVRRGGKKNRKHGRNILKCARYRASGRLERRKIKNLMRCCGLTRLQAIQSRMK